MLDNFKIAKAMKVIKKECIGTDGQCDMECCLYDDTRHLCKLATSIMGEPRDWLVGVDVKPLYTQLTAEEVEPLYSKNLVNEDGVIEE